MPQSEVADHDISSAASWLNRRADLHTCLYCLLVHRGQGPADCCEWVLLNVLLGLAGFLVVYGRVGVRAEPELCGAVLDTEVTERDIGDKVVWVKRMIEVTIFVDGLAHAAGSREGVVGRQPIEDGAFTQVSAHFSMAL